MLHRKLRSRFLRPFVQFPAVTAVAGLLCLSGTTAAWAQELSLREMLSSSRAVEASLPDGPSAGMAGGQAPGMIQSQPYTPPSLFHYYPGTIDVSLGVFPQLTGTRTSTIVNGSSFTQTTAGAAPSPGALATFHQQFRGWLGYDVNAGFNRTAFNYTAATGSGSGGANSSFTTASVGTEMFELSLGYVVKAPATTRRLRTFAQGGGGVLAFLPTKKLFPGAVNFRATTLFGAGADYRLGDNLGLRVEYRGLFYKTPDFVQSTSQLPTSKLFTVTSQPTVSLTYHFGPRMHGMQ